MVTLADVARHAQVAQSTVHYVLSGKRPISEDTRRRVQNAIDELGYHPHAGARALPSRRSSVLALVHPLRPELRLPLQMVLSVVTTARGHEHDVLLLTGDEGPEGMRRVARSALVDGFVLMDVELHDERVGVLRELGPARRADRRARRDRRPDLRGPRLRGRRGAVRRASRRRSAIARSSWSVRRPRSTGAGRASPTARWPASPGAPPSSACPPPTTPATARPSRSRRRSTAHPGATAFVVHNAIALRPVLDALRVSGRDVPWDVSVVALAPDELGSAPAVTTVPLPSEEMGRRAVELLMGKLDGAPDSGATLLAPELAVRGSTAPVR